MGILGSGLACLTCAGTFFWESASWWGESWADTGRLFRIAHTLATTRGCRRGGVAGAEPPHKGGPNRPDRPEKQWLVVSGQRRRLTYFRVESGLDIVSLLPEVQESSPQNWDAPRGKHLFPRRTRRGTENGFFCPRRARRGAENCCLVRGGGEGGQLREKEFTVSM